MAGIQYSEDLFISQDGPDSEKIANNENNREHTELPSKNENKAEVLQCGISSKEPPTLSEENNFRDSHDCLSERSVTNETNNCEITDPSLSRESNVSCGNGQQNNPETDVPREDRLSQLPFARIKQLMKVDCEINIISAEAIFVVTKATELFVQTLAKDACSYTMDSKKKNMSKADIEKTISNTFSLKFLEGMMNL
uniref:Putative dna polymerase epsilon subunit 4 n=1 Tax=Anopheles triannulatus TaxID=58253 RepID=A0A2M4AZ76_9DIPT